MDNLDKWVWLFAQCLCIWPGLKKQTNKTKQCSNLIHHKLVNLLPICDTVC